MRLGRSKSHQRKSRNSSTNKENTPAANSRSKDPFHRTISFNYCNPDQNTHDLAPNFSKTHNADFYHGFDTHRENDQNMYSSTSQFRAASPFRAVSPNQRVVCAV